MLGGRKGTGRAPQATHGVTVSLTLYLVVSNGPNAC
jgi:hypothetical protein